MIATSTIPVQPESMNRMSTDCVLLRLLRELALRSNTELSGMACIATRTTASGLKAKAAPTPS
jgi:hypothetical protein